VWSDHIWLMVASLDCWRTHY